MKYYSFGAGSRAFVILPGLSLKSVLLSADVVAASYSAFAKDHTVYLFDVPEKPPRDYTISRMAEETAEAMRTLGIEGADVFGCSMGGMAAQYIAARHPGLIRKMVLGSSMAHANATGSETLRRWAELADSGDVRALNRDSAERVYSPDYFGQFREIFASLENEGTPEELERFSILARACLESDTYDLLDSITCPVLVMGSWGDKALSGDASVEIARKLGCALVMYSNYGHAVYDEAPDYKARMLDFFVQP